MMIRWMFMYRRLRQFERAKDVLRRAIAHRLDLDASASRMLECALIEVGFEELHYMVECGRIR